MTHHQGNFHGAEILIVTKASPIHSRLVGIRRGTLNEPVIAGLCGEILKVARNRLNFEYKMMLPAVDDVSADKDDEFSDLGPILNATLKNRFDMILAPVSISSDNYRRLGITAPYYLDDFIIIVNMKTSK